MLLVEKIYSSSLYGYSSGICFSNFTCNSNVSSPLSMSRSHVTSVFIDTWTPAPHHNHKIRKFIRKKKFHFLPEITWVHLKLRPISSVVWPHFVTCSSMFFLLSAKMDAGYTQILRFLNLVLVRYYALNIWKY